VLYLTLHSPLGDASAKTRQGIFDGTKKLVRSPFLQKRAWQSAFTILIFFNREPFFGPCQLLRDEFSSRLRAVAFPIQLGIGRYGSTHDTRAHPWAML
jgi:hypothetical protein